MQLVFYRKDYKNSWGDWAGDHIIPLEGDPFGWFDSREEQTFYAADAYKILCPCRPSKIICIGRNYREHAAELGNEVPREPLLFLKPSSSVIGPGDMIRRPPQSQQVDYEGELAIVMKKFCYHMKPQEVASCILGYTIVNDVTARDLQKKDGQWTRSKSFDTFCPIGPCIATDFDPSAAEIITRVNGEVRQKGNTRDLIFPIDVLVSYVSQVMTLFPGDVISTGTPAGVGPLVAGDVVEVEIEGIGVLKNPVENQS